MLDVQENRFKNKEKHLSCYDMMKLITPLKNDGEHTWLYEVSNSSLQETCKDLNDTYQRVFKKLLKKPHYKSRKLSKPKFPLRSDGFYFKNSKQIYVRKIGLIKYRTDFLFKNGRNCTFYNPRISCDGNRWFLSFSMECENQTSILTSKQMGIDLGVKELAVVAIDDDKIIFHNINKSARVRKLESEQKRLQRNISRKYESGRVGLRYVKTNNIRKQEDKLRKVYRRIANIRHNYIHQTTHALVSMLPKRIVMEDLNVKGLMKNKYLAKSIQGQCWYKFIRQMRYKCAWSGIEFIQVDRFYPSSKVCSCCGAIKKDLKLKDRTYVCNECGFIIDRDFNAAINLSRYVA